MHLSQKRQIALTILALSLTACLPAQTAPPKPKPAWKQQELTFADGKPMTGLPLGAFPTRTHCTQDGTTFFDSNKEATASVDPSDLLRISTTGEVTRLRRKMPLSPAGPVSILSFAVGTHDLITLLKVDHPDDAPHADPHYLLSVSDHDGDFPKLIDLDLRFTPLKVGVFGTGEYLILGWDDTNREPLLATIKENGSVDRFLQFNNKELDLLRKAEFVPWGNDLMVTYPGTATPMRLLHTSGEEETISLLLPGGYVLHDLMGTSRSWVYTVRAQQPGHPKDMRIFEMSSYKGELIRELTADKQRIAAITCAPGRKLTAIFEEAIAPKDNQPSSNTEPAKQWVITQATR